MPGHQPLPCHTHVRGSFSQAQLPVSGTPTDTHQQSALCHASDTLSPWRAGESTSRLAADPATVADQFCLNLDAQSQLSDTLSPWRAGEITSRLAADTTTMADQFCLNLNVLMRSLTQAALVLAFMFRASWRLTVITFVLVPVSVTISKTFGSWFRCDLKPWYPWVSMCT